MKQESVIVALNISFIAAVWLLSICLFFKVNGRLWSIDKGGAAKDVALPASWLSRANGDVRVLLAYRTTMALYCLVVCLYTWFNRVRVIDKPHKYVQAFPGEYRFYTIWNFTLLVSVEI